MRTGLTLLFTPFISMCNDVHAHSVNGSPRIFFLNPFFKRVEISGHIVSQKVFHDWDGFKSRDG